MKMSDGMQVHHVNILQIANGSIGNRTALQLIVSCPLSTKALNASKKRNVRLQSLCIPRTAAKNWQANSKVFVGSGSIHLRVFVTDWSAPRQLESFSHRFRTGRSAG